MDNILYVLIGGGIGAVLRNSITSLFKRFMTKKHYATFIVNITGSFILGYLFAQIPETSTLYKFLITGVIASYTTFSTFEYENIDLIAHEEYAEFLKYSTLSCCCGFTAVLLGVLCSQLF